MNKFLLLFFLLQWPLYARADQNLLTLLCTAEAEAEISRRYQFFADGTVLDRDSGLRWQRCYHGQSLNNQGNDNYLDDRCDGEVTAVSGWQQLMQLAQQQYQQADGWRLPSRRELQSISDRRCGGYYSLDDTLQYVAGADRPAGVFPLQTVTETSSAATGLPVVWTELSNTLVAQRRVFITQATESRSYLTPAFVGYPDTSPLAVFSAATLTQIRQWYPDYDNRFYGYSVRWVKNNEN